MATTNNSNNSIIGIKDFFSRHRGLQRSNRFSMSFLNLPRKIPQIENFDLNPLAIAISGRAIDGVADNLAGYGLGRTVPRSQKFPEGVMLNFAITNDHQITYFFNEWFNAIYAGGRQKGDYTKPFQLSYYDDIIYNTQMNINYLDPNGNINATYEFYEVYPVECLPQEVSMLKNDLYSVYSVLMMFRDFNFVLPVTPTI
jgi:hypothetical protein